jgi:hypothetical protein
MICPFAIWRPVPSHGGPRTEHRGVVYHVTTSHIDPYSYFGDPAHQASSHFWVGADGTLEQYIDTDLASWAQMAANNSYGSIELSGTVDEAMTRPQLATLGRLIGWWRLAEGNVWPIAAVDHGGLGITAHCHWPSGIPDPDWGGHRCPGRLRLAQMPAVIAAAAGPPPPPTPAKEDDMKHLVLIRETSSPTVFIGDFVTRRSVINEAQLAGIQWWLSQLGGDNTVHVIGDGMADVFGTLEKT